MRTATIKVNYEPHAGQVEVLDQIMASNADVIIIICSRGWGKTLFVVGSIVLPPILKYPNLQVCWIAPNYKIAKAPIEDVFFGVNENTGERFINDKCPETGFTFFEYKKGDNELHFWNDAKLFLRSADAPESIVSKGYNLVVIDEGALISKTVFQQNILPIARKKNCKIVIITTPRGKNWVYHLFLDGKDPAKPRYFAVQQPWNKRPDYPPLLIDLMKDLPDHVRRQEFGAEFIDGGGGIFKNLDGVFRGALVEFESDQQEWYHSNWKNICSEEATIMAIDWAKSVDFTVITVFSLTTKKMIYYARINKTDYKTVLEKCKMLGARFDCTDLIYDATGVGSGLTDFIPAEFNAIPYVFTNQSKNDLINKLIMSFEYGVLDIPNISTVRNEFEILELSFTKTGKFSYEAPDGKHDDCVMSIALANFYIEDNTGVGEVGEIDSIIDTYHQARKSILEDEDDD
jgi:hypothetical protein